MTDFVTHRLDGLEHDNLLAFMALLGLLRALEEERLEKRLEWHARVHWTVDEHPPRPVLRVPEGVNQTAVVQAVAEGVSCLSKYHDFHAQCERLYACPSKYHVRNLEDLSLPPKEAARYLRDAADRQRYPADLWAALTSDKASHDGEKSERTPFHLLAGQQHFLEYLESVPGCKTPPDRGTGKNKTAVSETECLEESLFTSWKRLDNSSSFRWDPNEDVRYALRANAPSDRREPTQHGANRLAAIGLSVLTVVPKYSSGKVVLAVLGGRRERGNFVFRWPIWRNPVSLACIRVLLSHPALWPKDDLCCHCRQSPSIRGDPLTALGIAGILEARRISPSRYKNFTRAEPVECSFCGRLVGDEKGHKNFARAKPVSRP